MALRRPYSWLLLALPLLPACSDDGPAPAGSSGSSSSGTSSSGPGPTTDEPTTMTPPDPSAGTGSATGGGESSSGAAVDSTGSSADTTAGAEGADSSGSSGAPPEGQDGCADGEREALVDDVMYPDIAACGGGWSVPGVLTGTPFCDRSGGDDGPNPEGRGCTVDDLCAEGWHLCTTAAEVSDAGIANCEGLEWNESFFVTAQSGGGVDACNAVGTNDVFGCGAIGYAEIVGCAPLNRGTGNLCASLPEPWECAVADDSEAEFIIKTAPELGGALCCRD